MDETCQWSWDDLMDGFETECNWIIHFQDYVDLKEEGFNFCPNCGAKITEIKDSEDAIFQS